MKQKFLVFDIVRTENGEIGFVTDSTFNSSQTQPIHQFQYSVEFLTENEINDKNAWYNDDELEFTGRNFLEILGEKISHPFCSGKVSIDLKDQRR